MRSILVAAIALGALSMASCNNASRDAMADAVRAQKAAAAAQANVREEHDDHARRHVDAPLQKTGNHDSEQANDLEMSAHVHADHKPERNGENAIKASSKIAIGDSVPDFEVTIDGKPRKFSEPREDRAITEDGALVLTFWCSFCHSCRDVEHALDDLAKEYKGRVGVIALDASVGETTNGVAGFAKKHELTFPIALDPSGTAADIFGARVTTTTVVIDKRGVLRYRGQFSGKGHKFAADALRALQAGEKLPAQETRQKG